MTPHSRPSLDREELRAAVRAYGLRGPVQFEPIGRGASASAKGRLRTPDGDFMLKRRSARTWSTERASFLHRFQEHLFAAGVPVARLARIDGRAASCRRRRPAWRSGGRCARRKGSMRATHRRGRRSTGRVAWRERVSRFSRR